MPTLTEASIAARKAIKYGAIGFVLITVFWYLGLAGIDLYKKAYPKAPPPPTVDFGVLQPLNFPKNESRPKLSLELPTGSIPNFPDRMRVYKAPTKRSGFSDPARATEIATRLGFLFKPEKTSDVDYVWTIQDQLNSKLEMNIISGHFLLSRQWQNNPALAVMANFTSEKDVISQTEAYIGRIGLLANDIVGVEKITYLRTNGSQLVPALSLSDADFLQVDLFRKEIEEIDPAAKEKVVVASYPFYRTDPNKGLFRILVSGGRNENEKFVTIENNYTEIQYENSGTYPIKTGAEAWEELSKGGGYVTQTSRAKQSEVKIRRIFLGYYDSADSQNYAMPIYIFLGDNGFVAYVSAVKEAWIKSN